MAQTKQPQQARSQVQGQTQATKEAGQAPNPGRRADQTLTRFIQVTEAALSADSKTATGAILVNRVSDILPVDRVVLVSLRGRGKIEAVSGGGAAAQDSRFGYAVRAIVKRMRRRNRVCVIPDESESKRPHAQVLHVQQSMQGTKIAWLPLRMTKSDKQPLYALWLERWGQSRSWRSEELELLEHVSVFFGNAIARRRGAAGASRKALYLTVAILAVVGTLLVPVRNSTTAPSNVVPKDPIYVFAPLEGILKTLVVRPGDVVKKGDVLWRYEARVLEKSLDEARRTVQVSRAELERLQGASYQDPEARAQIPVQQLEVSKSEADLAFNSEQLERADVRAIAAGMVVLDNPDGLIGLPLKTGQVVMQLADPDRTRLRIMVPVSDVGLVEEGAEVEVRLDRAPLKSIEAEVTSIGFDVVESEEKVPSIIVYAKWVGSVPDIRPGQKGSAKIFSPPRALGMQIFRKPLISLRQISGF